MSNQPEPCTWPSHLPGPAAAPLSLPPFRRTSAARHCTAVGSPVGTRGIELHVVHDLPAASSVEKQVASDGAGS